MKLEKYRKVEGGKISLVVRRVDDLDSVHTAIVFQFLNKKLLLVEFHSKKKRNRKVSFHKSFHHRKHLGVRRYGTKTFPFELSFHWFCFK